MVYYCPKCNEPMEMVLKTDFTGCICFKCGSRFTRGELEKKLKKKSLKKNFNKNEKNSIALEPLKYDIDLIKKYESIYELNGISKMPYVKATLTYIKPMKEEDYLDSRFDLKLQDYIDGILYKESPISVSKLYHILIQKLELSDNKIIFNRFRSLINGKISSFTKSLDGGDVAWSLYMSPSSYKRFRTSGIGIRKESITTLSKEEIRNAMCFSFEKNDKTITIKRTALLLGYDYLDNESYGALVNLYNGLIVHDSNEIEEIEDEDDEWTEEDEKTWQELLRSLGL